MPKFDVTVTRILEVSTTITVSAKNEDEASEKAENIASKGSFTWNIQDKNEWEEQSDSTQVDDVNEA